MSALSQSWVLLVIIGSIANVLINAGYRSLSTRGEYIFFASIGFAIASLIMFGYCLYMNKVEKIDTLLSPTVLFTIMGCGIGAALSTILLLTAMASGPFSLVNVSWLSLMILGSAIVGVVFLKDSVSPTSIAGMVLALSGVVLMTKG